MSISTELKYMRFLGPEFFVLLFSFSIFNDRRSLKQENENNGMKTRMHKFDHGSLIYGTVGVQERVLVRLDKRAIRVRAIEVLLYIAPTVSD